MRGKRPGPTPTFDAAKFARLSPPEKLKYLTAFIEALKASQAPDANESDETNGNGTEDT
jgi:hypothetical protein